MNTATRILLLSGRRLPRNGLLLYLARPNSDEYLVGEDTEIGEDKSLTAMPAPSKPGDSVTLRAERDVFVVVTACSMDVEPINGDRCTGLRLEVLA